MTDLFLINSVIQIGNQSWSYSEKRSYFSPVERFRQTLQSIDSIRTKMPNAIIVFVECSDIYEEMKNILISKVDFFYNLYEDQESRKNILETNNKGLGEAFQTKKALEFISEKKIHFTRFFKLSGRYYLNDNFDKSTYSIDEFTFKTRVSSGDGGIAISTVIYSVPIQLMESLYNNLLLTIQFYMIHGPAKGYEQVLPPLCNPRKEMDIMGASGYVAVSENEFFSC